MILALLISVFPNFIKVSLLRIQGHHIGKKARLGFASVIRAKGTICLGDSAHIGSFSYIKCNNLHLDAHSRIASLVYISTPEINIGRDCQISSLTIIRSGHICEESSLLLGNLVHIFPFVTIDCSRRVFIDDETGIGPHCNIFTHGSYKSVLQGYPVTYGDVHIGKRVELTYSVFVSPGITIGDDAICAYGSYVNKDIPEGVLAAGMPALVKRSKDQITGDISYLNAREILENIIIEYKKCIILINGREPARIELRISQETSVEDEGSIYMIYNSSIINRIVSHYGLFDISEGVCLNSGVEPEDFNGLRQFLSRYGIRFLTQTEAIK